LCTFILAAKACPTGVRGEYFGVAAACGKVGAFIGIWIFPPMVQAFGGANTIRGNTGPFWVASGLCVLSAVISLFFVHPLSEEGIIKEDRDFREYLEMHGYDTSAMGLREVGRDSVESDNPPGDGIDVKEEKRISEEEKVPI